MAFWLVYFQLMGVLSLERAFYLPHLNWYADCYDAQEKASASFTSKGKKTS